MKHRFLYIMALLLTAATGAWADDDPAPISLTSSADGTVWTLSTMPEYDVELEVTYKTDLTLTVSLSGWTYGATANTPTVTGNTGNGAVTYNYKKKDADDETYSAEGIGFIRGIDGYKFKTPADNTYKVDIYTDNSVMVMYINDNVCYTNRIYGINKNCWSINGYGADITISDVKVSWQ